MKELSESHLLADFAMRRVHESDVAGPNLDLLADQLQAIVGKLRGHSVPAQDSELRPSNHPQAALIGFKNVESQRAAFAQAAKETYMRRRKRTGIFGSLELFGEPAWDILLDLYVAQVECKPVSVSSACIGSAAPPTTGLRWLGVLAENDLILREHDPEDQRRVLVRLTDNGLAMMDDYFASTLAAT